MTCTPERVEALERRREALIDEATDPSTPPGEVAPQAPGYPWAPLLGYPLLAMAVLAEGWQLALPYLDATGVDSSDLSGELARNPIGLSLGMAFAMSAALALLVLYDAALGHLRWLLRDTSGERRRASAIGLTLFGSLALLVSMTLAGLRHGTGTASAALAATLSHQSQSGPGGGLVFLTLSIGVPLACAHIHARLAALWRKWHRDRAGSLALQLHLAERGRGRAVAVKTLDREIAELGTTRGAALWHLRIECASERAAHDPGRDRLRIAEQILVSLELERYHFIRHARRRGFDGHLASSDSVPSSPRLSSSPAPLVAVGGER